MDALFYSILGLLTGLTTASLCLTKNSFGGSFHKYCYDSCCYYDSYSDPCCTNYTLSIGAIAGLVVGLLALMFIIVLVTCCCYCALRRRHGSSGEVITTTQPGVAYITQNQSKSLQGIPQSPGHDSTGFVTETATQPPAYNEALQIHPQQQK